MKQFLNTEFDDLGPKVALNQNHMNYVEEAE